MSHDDAGTSPAGEGRRSPFRAVRRAVAVAGALGAGVAGAVFGTLLHAQVVHVGSVALPVGALAALVLAGSLFLLTGLWARSILLTAMAGAVAYGVVALLSTSSKTLILTGSSPAAPGAALAGNLWLFGVLVVTLGAVMVCAVVLRPVHGNSADA